MNTDDNLPIQHLIDAETHSPTLGICGEPFVLLVITPQAYKICPACELAHQLLLAARAAERDRA